MTLPSQHTPGPDHAGPRPPFVKRAKKAVVAACGLAATLVAAGILDHLLEAVVTGLLGVATTYGVYKAENAKTPPV